MPEAISPQQLQQAAKKGFDRIKKYRRARAMFLRAYVGKYFASGVISSQIMPDYGLTGDEPVNMIFNAIRIMVPNLVMRDPKVSITTEHTSQKDYGELLELGTNNVIKQIELMWPLRSWIVDALFGFGIMKTALKSSDSFVEIGDVRIDPGQVYSETVDLDNFTFDPTCMNPLFRDASFLGDAVVVPRQYLLDTNGYDHDLVMRLPGIDSNINKNEDVAELSKVHQHGQEFAGVRDLVRVVDIWVPEAQTLVTIPDPRLTTFDKYIRMVDYYGPQEGPYTFLSFTPPVPNNPFPIAPVSIWYDLHTATNRVFKKILDQAERQKDVTLYSPAQAETADDIRDARDGEYVASTDPSGVKVVSYGGQNPQNEAMLSTAQTWFNYMSGGVEQLGGTRSAANTATQAEILSAGQNVTLEDARLIISTQTGKVGRNIAWHLDTDPLIDMPLTKRKGNDETSLRLTPEQRRGDFLDFVFTVLARSMQRMDPAIKSRRMVELASSIIPAAAQAAQICMQMGTPFDFARFITGIAEEMGIEDWIVEVFQDPRYEEKLAIMLQLGPQNPGKATGVGTPMNGGNKIQTPRQEQNQQRQEPAALSQAARTGGEFNVV